jgi:hypothetical protein
MRQFLSGLVAIGMLIGTSSAYSTDSVSGNSVSGEAFGVSVDVSVNGAGVTVGPTPHVVLPSNGGMVREQVLRINVPNLVTSATLEVVTTGSIGPGTASAQSSATVEELNLLNGLVRARLVVAMSSSTADGARATSTGEGSTLIGLSINGSSPADVTPAPNTRISPVPGVTVILNEQIASGDGVHTSALTVNMIHVVLHDPLTGAIQGHIIVASAHSDVNFVPAPKEGNAFMTGGGKLGTGRDIATFGLNAGSRGGGLHGQLQYNDHGQGLKVHSLSIDSFEQIAGSTCVRFSGRARVNTADGYSFTVRQACDHGEPGHGKDTFDVSVDGPGLSYSRGGTLTGGNLQLHPE